MTTMRNHFKSIKFSYWQALLVAIPVIAIGIYLIKFSRAYNADVNGDGAVNVVDLSILASNYGRTGMTHAQGDLNGDGAVNIIDLSILASNWGSTSGPITMEPSTVATTPAHVGSPYAATLTLSTGEAADWSILSGELPPGVTMSNGQLRGTPTQAGAYSFEVKAVFRYIGHIEKQYTILVYPPTSTGYETRVSGAINAHINTPWPPLTGGSNCINTVGAVNYAIANLWLNRNVNSVNDKLAAVNVGDMSCGDSSGTPYDSLWYNHIMRLYFLYNSHSSYFPGRLRPEVEQHILDGLWTWASTWGQYGPSGTVWIGSSENHQSQSASDLFLMSQIFKDNAAYAGRTFSDGHTVTEYYNSYHNFWKNYFDERAKRGLWVEVGSGYHGYTLDGILNMYNFADDPLIRKKAQMIMDVDYADFAQQEFNNNWGGSKSRVYPSDALKPQQHVMRQLGQLLFGPDQPLTSNHILLLATSGYYPPAVVEDLAHNVNQKGVYEYIARRPCGGNGCNPSISVLHYNFITPNFIIGAAEIDPNGDYPNASGQNRWEGIIFNTTVDARIYPQVGPTGSGEVKPYDAWVAVQKKGALITRKNGYASESVQIYFAQSLDQIDEEDGWLFVREGGSYVAVRPQTGGYSWLDPAKNNATDINKRFIRLGDSSSPMIFEAAQASDYGNNFANFKTNIKDNVRSYSSGIMNYTASDGTRLTLYNSRTIPQINGGNINFASTNVFNSPYLTSIWGSGKINVNFNGHSASYDFSNTNNPIKTTR